MTGITIRQADTPADIDKVRKLCWEYRTYLMDHSAEVRHAVSVFYGFEEYAALMARLDILHARPRGVILLAVQDGHPVACGMTRELSATDAEIKRVYVREQARGKGVACNLSRQLIEQAHADGYSRIFLDTSRQFDGAMRLYEKLGFKRRGPYSELPPGYADLLVFYEFTL